MVYDAVHIYRVTKDEGLYVRPPFFTNFLHQAVDTTEQPVAIRIFMKGASPDQWCALEQWPKDKPLPGSASIWLQKHSKQIKLLFDQFRESNPL